MSNTIKDHTSFLINNTLAANYLHRAPARMENSVELNIGGRGKRTLIAVKLYDDLSAMELALLDAVSSFYANQIYEFSVRELICYMNGCESKNITAVRVNKIHSMLRHLCSTSLSLHITEELQSRRLEVNTLPPFHWLEEIDNHQFLKGPLLALETLTTRKCVIQQPPLLYEYARQVNSQFQRIPPVLLKSIDGVSDTDRLFLIRYYLLHRLELLRYKQGQNDSGSYRIIWYSRDSDREGRDRGLMSQIMLKENTKDPNHQRRGVHQSVTAILDYFKSIGYIQDYEVITGRRGISEGIEILGDVANPSECSGGDA